LINIILDIINYILVAILIGVSATWIALIKSMLRTFNESPFLDKFEKKEHEKPKVSIIYLHEMKKNLLRNVLILS